MLDEDVCGTQRLRELWSNSGDQYRSRSSEGFVQINNIFSGRPLVSAKYKVKTVRLIIKKATKVFLSFVFNLKN